MVIDGLTNTVIVEAAGASIDPAATNALWLALAANNSALTAAIAAKADKAWGQYAPDGSANPDPDYMVWLNTPAVTYAAGLTWTTYGTYAALSTSGTVAFESGGRRRAAHRARLHQLVRVRHWRLRHRGRDARHPHRHRWRDLQWRRGHYLSLHIRGFSDPLVYLYAIPRFRPSIWRRMDRQHQR